MLALAACCVGLLPRRRRGGGSAFVRVDQVGYPASAPKRAYLMSSRAEAGQPFDGALAADGSGRVQRHRRRRRWARGAGASRTSTRWTSTRCRRPARYTLSVGGARPRHSPPFAVADPAALYAGAAANALSFYENERDGPEFIPSPLRSAPAHLNDEHAHDVSRRRRSTKTGQFKRRTVEPGRNDRRRGRVVGRRRLPEVRADDQLHGRPAC